MAQLDINAATAAASSLLAVYVGLSLVGFLRLPRWRQHRHLVLLAAAAAVYTALDTTVTGNIPDFWHVQVARVQVLVAALYVRSWLHYAADDLGPLPGRRQRAFEWVALGAGLLYSLPGISLTGGVQILHLPWLGLTYRTADVLLVGKLAMLVLCGMLLVVTARYARAMRHGRPQAGVHFAALSLMLVCGTNDAFSASGFLPLPHLLGLGQAASVCLVALVLTKRWASDVQALDRLTLGLEQTVQERTRALAETQVSLARAERLAAVGRLAAGMAHEINNPAAALLANLDCLREQRARGLPTTDLPEMVEEMREATQRIAQTIRQLLLFSRAAEADADGASFEVEEVARRAAELIKRQLGTAVPVELSVQPGLQARGRGHLLEQVLVQLLTNAVQAVAPGSSSGRVALQADRAPGGEVRVRVTDNGEGMDEAVRARLFEPFFSTRPEGQGKGLGLAVSLGLLRALGGKIEVSSAPGRGTTMTVLVEAGCPLPAVAPLLERTRTPPPDRVRGPALKRLNWG